MYTASEPSLVLPDENAHRPMPPPNQVIHFDKYEAGVKAFSFPRPLESYKHFVMIFEISKSHPRYAELKQFLIDWVRQSKMTIGYVHQTINFKGSMQEKVQSIQQLSDQKVYFCDLRKEKDSDLGLQIDIHPDAWVNNMMAFTMLHSYRGCIVFADTITDIPHCWSTKSLCGLTSKDIDSFLRKGVGVFSPVKYTSSDNETQSLCGYVKMIRAHTFVEF